MSDSKFEVSLGAYSSGIEHPGRSWRLIIREESSRARVVELVLTAEQFANALSSLVVSGVDGELGPTHLLGSAKETMTLELDAGGWPYDATEHGPALSQLATYQAEGWAYRPEDLRNGHCRFTAGGRRLCRIALWRWVSLRNGKVVSP